MLINESIESSLKREHAKSVWRSFVFTLSIALLAGCCASVSQIPVSLTVFLVAGIGFFLIGAALIVKSKQRTELVEAVEQEIGKRFPFGVGDENDPESVIKFGQSVDKIVEEMRSKPFLDLSLIALLISAIVAYSWLCLT